MKKKRIIVLVNFLLLLTVLIACGGGSGPSSNAAVASEGEKQDTDVQTVAQSKDIKLVYPLTGEIKTGDTIVAKAEVVRSKNIKVKFVLDAGEPEERVHIDEEEPYEAGFKDVKEGEHSIDVYILDESGIAVGGDKNHDSVYHIGIGGKILVAVGDSITKGYPDYKCKEMVSRYCADNVSKDGRNSGGGFEPILNDLLTQERGYPFSVENEGVLGDTSAQGLKRLPNILKHHPEAEVYLIMYGTNDASHSNNVPVETYRNNMQQMIDMVKSRGKEPLLAKIPRVLGDSYNGPSYGQQNMDPENGERNIRIKKFNQAIDELVLKNHLRPAPDFYNRFKAFFGNTYSVSIEDGYADNLHPDGMGYEMMAKIWKESLSE